MPSPQEAMEWAADFCERNHIFDPPGAFADGSWHPPTANEKLAVIVQTAYAVVDAADRPSLVPPEVIVSVDWIREAYQNGAISIKDLGQRSRFEGAIQALGEYTSAV